MLDDDFLLVNLCNSCKSCMNQTADDHFPDVQTLERCAMPKKKKEKITVSAAPFPFTGYRDIK